MISVLIKGRNLYKYAYSEDDMKRHKDRIAIYKPKKKRLGTDSTLTAPHRNELC